MTENIVNFEDAKPKPAFKEKAKAWWSKNKETVLGWTTFIGVVVIPVLIIAISSRDKNESHPVNNVNYSGCYPEYDGYNDDLEELDGFIKDGDNLPVCYDVDYFDPDNRIPDDIGHKYKLIRLETDYTNLGNLGESIVKNFDVDPDILPMIEIEFATFRKESTEEN